MEIDDKMVFIEGEDHGRYPFSNSLLIRDKVRALVDTGSGEPLRDLAKRERVDMIIHTHCHEDHIAGDRFFDSEIAIHRLEAPMLERVEKLVDLYGMGESLSPFILNLVGCSGFSVDHKFEDGHIFDLGDIQLKAIHTPGHSMGHTCFFEEERGVLFLGDIDLSSFGPWYGALDSTIDDFISSIRRVKGLKPQLAISSHKGVIREGIGERLDAFLEKIYEREERILGFLTSNGRELEEVVAQALIYGNFPEAMRPFYMAMERTMVQKHLKRLIDNGKVERSGEIYRSL
jgi:glyoxylase-like metal-dependent hydrolase (beta-lactamase superfamily II)